MSDKVHWKLITATLTEARVVCVCGDVSVHILGGDDSFYLAKRVKGIWLRADNPLWPDLPSAMAEAERICRGTPEQQPETPPALPGEWQSCEHGIDVDGGDLVLYAWRGKLGWQYAAARVSCDVDDEDGSGTIELLDWNGNQVELEPSDYFMRIKR